jgi:HPt (histidine-containing phosphotransfer) domain-containing protein
MNEVIVKPVDPDALFLTLADWLGPQHVRPMASVQDDTITPTRAGAAATVPAEPAHLETLAVWDASALGRVVGNNQAAHVRLLQKYRSAAHDMVAGMVQCAANGEWKQAAEQAHKLKSSSRSVGAMRLGELCEALERAGRSGNGAACAALVQTVEAAFAEVDALISV